MLITYFNWLAGKETTDEFLGFETDACFPNLVYVKVPNVGTGIGKYNLIEWADIRESESKEKLKKLRREFLNTHI